MMIMKEEICVGHLSLALLPLDLVSLALASLSLALLALTLFTFALLTLALLTAIATTHHLNYYPFGWIRKLFQPLFPLFDFLRMTPFF